MTGFPPVCVVSLIHSFKVFPEGSLCPNKNLFCDKSEPIISQITIFYVQTWSLTLGKRYSSGGDTLNNLLNKYLIKIVLNILRKEHKFIVYLELLIYQSFLSENSCPERRALANYSHSCFSQQKKATFLSLRVKYVTVLGGSRSSVITDRLVEQPGLTRNPQKEQRPSTSPLCPSSLEERGWTLKDPF